MGKYSQFSAIFCENEKSPRSSLTPSPSAAKNMLGNRKDIDEENGEEGPQSSKSLKSQNSGRKLISALTGETVSNATPVKKGGRNDPSGKDVNGKSGEVKESNQTAENDNVHENGEGTNGSLVIKQPIDDCQPALVKIQARKVNCKSSDGQVFIVDWYLMLQSKQFKRCWEEHRTKKKGTNGRSRRFTFYMDNVDADTFRRVLEWLVDHDGMDDPVVREDPSTGDRVWFELTEFERRFFNVPLHILSNLLNAGKNLDITSMYLFGCQSMAALIRDKTPAEIREMLGLENDLTSTDIAAIRRRNRKFKMRELKAARYATRLQELQGQLQQMGLRQGAQMSGSLCEQLLLADVDSNGGSAGRGNASKKASTGEHA